MNARMPIDPRVDFAFKCLFGSQANKSILISLLRAILKLEIGDVELLNPFNLMEVPDDKLSILDVKARLVDGTLVNIEMQMVVSADYAERGLYYWAELFTEQLKQGDDYSKLVPTVAIHIINDVMFDEISDHHLEFEIRATDHPNLRLTDPFSLHTIELPKFQVTAEHVATKLDQWCYLFNHAEELESSGIPATLTDEAIKQAIEAMKVMFQTERERELYLARQKQARDELWKKNALDPEKRFQAGREVGVKEGVKEGLRQGIQLGLEKRFGSSAVRLVGRVRDLQDEARLRSLQEALFTVATLEEFEKALG